MCSLDLSVAPSFKRVAGQSLAGRLGRSLVRSASRSEGCGLARRVVANIPGGNWSRRDRVEYAAQNPLHVVTHDWGGADHGERSTPRKACHCIWVINCSMHSAGPCLLLGAPGGCVCLRADMSFYVSFGLGFLFRVVLDYLLIVSILHGVKTILRFSHSARFVPPFGLTSPFLLRGTAKCRVATCLNLPRQGLGLSIARLAT